MGYTSYWKCSKPLKVSSRQHALIDQILVDHNAILDVQQNDVGGISFNGIAPNDHEDFVIKYGKPISFGFCKTAAKPYDVAVCKVLLVLSMSDGFTFSSDGDIAGGEEGWGPANAWFAKVQSAAQSTPQEDEVISTRETKPGSSTYARYEHTTEGHNKFWEVEQVSPTQVEARWGKIGKAPQGTKKYPLAGIEKLMQEKVDKGYKLVSWR